MNKIEYLEWESKFFNLKIGQMLFEEYTQEIKNSDFDLILIRESLNKELSEACKSDIDA